MKREIKFRAYNPQQRKMFFDFDQNIQEVGLGKSIHLYVYETGLAFGSLLQFTGLKDKNGKEIYEGDILKSETDKFTVSWNKKFASFCLDRNGWAFSHWFGESCNPEDVEVIGNIFEHPELLKGGSDV